jgi:hypothetical protein
MQNSTHHNNGGRFSTAIKPEIHRMTRLVALSACVFLCAASGIGLGAAQGLDWPSDAIQVSPAEV